MNHTPSSFQLERAMGILMDVRNKLLTEDPSIADDERLLQDCLEGESGNAMDVIDNMVRAALHAESMAEAAKARADELTERSRRYANRKNMLRITILQAMEALDLRRRERPDFTVSIATGQQSVKITDAKLLPDRCVAIERTPIKSLISPVLEAGEEVPGAVLSNASPILTIRTK